MNVELVVTDLDNTLYDWVTYFVPSFYTMIETAARILGVSVDQLLCEMKSVHESYGSSEHPYSLLDAPTVKTQLGALPEEARKQYLNDAFHAFNRVRKQSLKLYDGVYETLLAIRGSGTMIVAYTDADVVNSLFRMVRLDLTQMIRRLYAPQRLTQIAYKFSQTSVPADYIWTLPAEDRKPNPKLLQDICRDYSVAPERTLYIGDSLIRDVFMAKQAGVHSALARYGTNYDPDLWSKLVRITHWTEADVQRENELQLNVGDIVPDVEIDHFSDILSHFVFRAPQPGPFPFSNNHGSTCLP